MNTIKSLLTIGMMIALPSQLEAQQRKSKIQIIDNLNDTSAHVRQAESISRSVNVQASIHRLAFAIKQVETWDTGRHVV